MDKEIRVLCVYPFTHRDPYSYPLVMRQCLPLVKAGAEVCICTSQGFRDHKGPQTLPHRQAFPNWIKYPVDIYKRLWLFWRVFRIIMMFCETLVTLVMTIRLQRRLRYDVIYLRGGQRFIFILPILGLFLKSRRIAISLEGSLVYKFTAAPVWKHIYRRSLHRNQFVFVTVSKDLNEYYGTKFLDGVLSGKVITVPLGVDISTNDISQENARQYLGLPIGKPIFLNFGYLHREHDIEVILAVIKDVPEILLVRTGKAMPEAAQILTQLIQDYDLQTRVIFRGDFVLSEDIPYHFAAADAIILSYIGDLMGPPSMLWEAAGFKTPVIASDSGVLGELVRRYKMGLLFKAQDAASLKGAISHFLGLSQSEREVMRRNCEQFCTDFSVDNLAQEHVRIFRELSEYKR